jgi:hypothetical protein
MHTNVLRLISVRFISSVVAVWLMAGTTTAWAAAPKQGKAGAALPTAASKAAQSQKTLANSSAPSIIKDWGPYLDVAYELTYWDRSEIKEWREKRDVEIGETLAAYRAAWNGRLATTPAGGTAAGSEELQKGFRDRDYLRLAIAQTIDYLQSGNQESLNAAEQLIERLKGKSSMPEIAYWTGYVKALLALERNDSSQFVAQVFNIWNNAILYVEQSETARMATNKSGSSIAPFYYRNLVHLVVTRAIIEKKMKDINALGPLFLILKDRDLGGKEGDGKYFSTLVHRIADGLTAPDSDRYRLNFTVALIESKRLQQAVAAKLDAEGMSLEAQKLFEQAVFYNELAFKWAASRRSSGVVSATADHLDITSFAIQRLPENEKAPAYKFFASLPSQDNSSTLLKSMAIFNDIAVYSDGGWKAAGYESRERYLKAAHRLWRAIMELSLWSGDFYLAKLTNEISAPTLNLQSLAMPLQILDYYLDFLASQNSRGFSDVVPDSAYFGAAEAAEKLAYAYYKVNMYSTENTAYNLWFFHRLQATELFPMAPREVSQVASVLKQDGRYNLFLDYFLPLAGRVKQSPVIKKWLEGQKTDTTAVIRDYVNSVDQIFASAPDTVADGAPYVASFQQLREEMQRKPDHPMHRLLKDFYMEEMQKNTSYTQLLKDPSRLNQGF